MKTLLIGLFWTALCFTCFSQPSIERVEPPFWWTGMKDNHLQIMIYGKDISKLRPVINDEKIVLEEVLTVESPNYLFIGLQIASGSQSGGFKIQFMDGSKEVFSRKYELKEREIPGEERMGFDQSDVIYLITPDRFANGDPSNDQVAEMKEKVNRSDKGGRHGGDLQGMMNYLDYIHEMGFTAIWLNPILENNMEKYSYHGYSTTDYYKVDPRYGSNELYLKFIEEADNRGIKVIMDVIVNHCGSEHWWMKDLPQPDWVNFPDTLIYSSHRRETIQDPYASEYDKRMHADGWFDKTMPDLNQRNPLLGEYLIQNAIWWIEYSGLSGIRMDTYPYPDMNYMAEWSRRIMQEYPNFNIVGEEWSTNPAIIAYWQKGKQNPNGYQSHLKTLMDFPIQSSLVRALIEEEHKWSNNGLRRLYVELANDFLYPNPNNLVVFGDNHDMKRLFSQLNEDYDLYKLAMAYLATIRGIPQVYYGTEILMTSTDDHGIIRTDFPGGWVGDQINVLTGKGLSPQQLDAKDFTRRLLNWRKTAAIIHNGKLIQYAPENGVYVYFRYNKNQMVMVVLNKNETETKLPLFKYRETLKNALTGMDPLTQQKYELSKEFIRLPARSPLILEISR